MTSNGSSPLLAAAAAMESKVRIMFVDNDLDYLEMVEHAAAASDTFVAIQNGGQSALSKLALMNYQVDAVVTDLAMSDMDGITLTEQVRRQERIRRAARPIDIYWFTGFGWHPDDENDPITKAAKDLGVKKVFTKPYDVMDIVEEVRRETENDRIPFGGGVLI
jgi:CheY-like chemotaxis protein